MKKYRTLFFSLVALLIAGMLLLDAYSPHRVAVAQTAGDTKLVPGTAGHLVSCSKVEPQISFTQGNELDLALLDPTFGSGGAMDNCMVIWNLERDHPTGGAPSVSVHFFKRATNNNYGRIACKEMIEQHSVQGTDSVYDVSGAWNQTNDLPSDPNGVPLTMVLQPPAFISYLNGHTPTWAHGGASVICDFGDDYVVTDVEWTESGAD